VIGALRHPDEGCVFRPVTPIPARENSGSGGTGPVFRNRSAATVVTRFSDPCNCQSGECGDTAEQGVRVVERRPRAAARGSLDLVDEKVD
jgi:hypothetical protein